MGPVTMRNSAAVSAQQSVQVSQASSKQFANINTSASSASGGIGSGAGAEEIAAAFSGKMQSKKAKQETSQELGSHLQRRINSIQKIQALATVLDIHTSVASNAKSIEALVRSGGDLVGWCDEENEKGVEPAEIFLSLKSALLTASDSDKPAIERAIQNLVRENGTSIQTSFNVATTVAKAYPDQRHAQTMRKAIGEGNQQNYDTRSIVDLLLKHFGAEDFGRSLDTYGRSQRADLNSLQPSTAPDYLEDMVNNLHAVNGARSLVSDCNDLLLDTTRIPTANE